MTSDVRLFTADGFALDEAAWEPATVRGADKVAQRALYALLTPAGTVPGRTAGCPFLVLARDFHSEFDVFVAWAASADAVAADVRAAELADEADSEKLGTVRLLGVTVVADEVTVGLAVTALDGSTPSAPVEFALPT